MRGAVAELAPVWVGQTWEKKARPRRGKPMTIKLTKVGAGLPQYIQGKQVAGPGSRTVLGLPAEVSVRLDDLLRDWRRV